MQIRFVSFCVAVLLACAPFAHAQKKPKENARVAVKYSFAFKGAANLWAWSQELGTPNSRRDDSWASTGGLNNWTATDARTVWMTPGKKLELVFGCDAFRFAQVHFDVPAGYSLYKVENDQIRKMSSWRNPTDFNGAAGDAVATFTIYPDDGSQGLAAGIAQPFGIGDVTWGVGLGSTDTGASVGAIRIRDTNISNLFTPNCLIYEDPDYTVKVIRDGAGALRQVAALQCNVDVVTLNTSSYELRFYPGGGVDLNQDGPYTFGGSPFVVYKFERIDPPPGTAGQALLVSRTQDSRTETWTLIQDSNNWTVKTTNNGVTLTTVSTTRLNSQDGKSYRVETATTSDATGVASVVERWYRAIQGSPYEDLWRVVADPAGVALTTTYDYVETPYNSAGWGKLKSVIYPDGSFERYDYDSSTESFGALSSVYSSWREIAASPATASSANARVTKYSFTNERGSDYYFRDVVQAVEETAPAGSGYATISKTDYNPTLAGTAPNNQPLRQETVRQYANASTFITSVTYTYHPTADRQFAGRLYARENADGTKESTVFYRALWWNYGYTDATVHKNYSGSDLSAAVWGEHHFYGFSTAVPGSIQIGQWNGQSMSPVYVVPNRSRVQLLIYQNGLVRYVTDYLITGVSNGEPTLAFLGMEERLYTTAGWLWKTLKHNGEYGREKWYTGDEIVWDVSNDGIWTWFERDPMGRVKYSKKTSVDASGDYPAQAEVFTHFTYDAAGHVLKEVTSSSSDPAQSGPTISRVYNLAGQLLSETNVQGLTTTFAYASGGRIVTATLPGGATQITTKNYDGSVKSTSGTGVIPSFSTVSVSSSGTESGYRVERTYSATDNGPRWTQIVTDWLGRTVREERPAPGGAVFQKSSYYDGAGRLTKTAETGMAATLYTYDALGELEYSGLDVNSSGALELASNDRITRTRSNYVSQESAWWMQTLSYTYPNANNDAAVLSAESLTRLTGFAGTLQAEVRSFDAFRNKTISTKNVDRNARLVTDKSDVSDSSSDVIKVTRNGLAQTQQNAQSQVVKFRYDGLGRLVETVDPRIGSSTRGYYGAAEATGVRHQLAWEKDPVGNTTSYSYEQTTGRLASQVNAMGKSVHYAYDNLGRAVRTWGEATYPVEYEYSQFGEKTKMRTFRDMSVSFDGATWPYSGYPSPSDKGDYTTWNFDSATGLLGSKLDALNRSVSYTYNSLGQLLTRTWGRKVANANVVTTYGYDPATAEQTSITYSDGTPNLTYTYNRRGQMATVSDYTGARSFQYANEGKLTAEFLPAFFEEREVHWPLDTTTDGAKGRTTNLTMGTKGSGSNQYYIGYGYDGYGRVNFVGGVTYTYTPNSNLIANATDDGGSWVQTRQYEPNRNVLTDIETLYGSTSVARFHYVSDALGRRTSKTESGAMFGWYSGQSLQTAWDYNARSEIQASTTRDAGTGTALGGRSFTYAYDPIGNRKSSTVDSISTTYAANALNQYDNRTDSGQVLVSGLAPAGATVTANSQAAARQGEYFSKFLGFSNTTGPVWANINTVSSFGGSFVRNCFVPMTPETYTYDEDGNLLTDGRWVYTWDAENRLISMETRDLAYNVGVPRQKLEFRYDYLGRRVLKQVSGWTGGAWAINSQRRFLYDGWNMITEFNTTSGYALAANHVWGIDLSGNLQDAGGVGGLVRSFHYEATNALVMPAYDGNGNVYNLIDRNNGGRIAAYEYSPFGETLRASGALANANPFRFSTKYTDNETQMLYYGRRYYAPSLGRFLGRDPSEEEGGLHLYAFVANQPTNLFDALGLVGERAGDFDPLAMIQQYGYDRIRPDANGIVHPFGLIPEAVEKQLILMTAALLGTSSNQSMFGTPLAGSLALSTQEFWVTANSDPTGQGNAYLDQRGVGTYYVNSTTNSSQYGTQSQAVEAQLQNMAAAFTAPSSAPASSSPATAAPNSGPDMDALYGGTYTFVTDQKTGTQDSTMFTDRNGVMAPVSVPGIKVPEVAPGGFMGTSLTAGEFFNSGAQGALGGAAGFQNALFMGLTRTDGFDPASVNTGQSIGVATNITLAAASATAATAKVGPAVGDALFARGTGLLNSNDYVRIGWNWKGSATTGSEVFRIAIGNKRSWIHWHYP